MESDGAKLGMSSEARLDEDEDGWAAAADDTTAVNVDDEEGVSVLLLSLSFVRGLLNRLLLLLDDVDDITDRADDDDVVE